MRQRQALLIERLATALASQQAVLDRLSAWLPRAATATGGPEPTELVTWQRQVAQWLDRASGRPRDRGAVQLLDELLRLFDRNRLADPETDALLNRLARTWRGSRATSCRRSKRGFTTWSCRGTGCHPNTTILGHPDARRRPAG